MCWLPRTACSSGGEDRARHCGKRAPRYRLRRQHHLSQGQGADGRRVPRAAYTRVPARGPTRGTLVAGLCPPAWGHGNAQQAASSASAGLYLSVGRRRGSHMTHQTVGIRLPPELYQRLAALAAEAILGRSVEEVLIHFARNALHRDWVSRPVAAEKSRISEPRKNATEFPAKVTPPSESGVPATKRLLRLRDVSRLVGLGRSSIYRLVNLGLFPAPRKLGARSVAWLDGEVESWIDARTSTA